MRTTSNHISARLLSIAAHSQFPVSTPLRAITNVGLVASNLYRFRTGMAVSVSVSPYPYADAFRLACDASLVVKDGKTDSAFHYPEVRRSQDNTNGSGR
jgi:hypothetical protein